MKSILKAVLIAVALVCIPLILVVLGATLSVVGPVAGILMLIFLPAIIIGILIEKTNKKGD